MDGALFVHGCPPKSISDYIFEPDDEEFSIIFNNIEERICFVGHTHTLQAISFADRIVRHHRLQEGTFDLNPRARYIICVGSVGQPRDGYNSNAKYALWDSGPGRLEIRSVPYEASRTAEKIISLGFPRTNAYRLF